MWERVVLPRIDGPVRGFTFPCGDVLFVLTPSGLVRVALDPLEVRTVADAGTLASLYDPATEKLSREGEQHLVYDADGGDTTLCDHPNGERLEFDPTDGTLLVVDGGRFVAAPANRVVRQRITSVRLPIDAWPSGAGWLFVGFSPDYRWLVAGGPGGVQVFRQTDHAGPGAAADGGA